MHRRHHAHAVDLQYQISAARIVTVRTANGGNLGSVTVPAVYDWLTLGFGYHTEHHLFPAMSTRHAPTVRDLLVAKWPERYQSMPLGEALLRLHRTARVYRDDVTLTDPRTGAVWSVLLPRQKAA